MEKAYLIAKIFSDNHNLIYFEKHFYLYNEGIWRLESDENSKAWITVEYISNFQAPPKKTTILEIIDFLQTLTYEKYRKEIKYRNEENIVTTINTKTGVLDLATLKVKPYEKKDFCFYKLPFDYIKNPKCTQMMNFLTSSMDFTLKDMGQEACDDYKKTMGFIQEWMGYSLIAGNRLQKSLILVGEGGNGKGKLQEIWEYIIGRYNTSYVDLRYINDGSQIFMTRNKLVNFSKDLESNQQLDTGIVKAAIAGEIVIANEKFKGQQEMSFSAKIVIACNELPYIRNAGNAIRRRFHVLPFTRIFTEEEQDRELLEKLISEADQIFSWAVNGLKTLNERKNFDVPDRCKYSLTNYLKNNDSIQLWLEENDLRHPGATVKTSDLYSDYKIYCEQSGLRPLSNQKLYTKLEATGFTRKTINGVKCFEGLKTANQTLL